MKLIDPYQLAGVAFAFTEYEAQVTQPLTLTIVLDDALPAQGYRVEQKDTTVFLYAGDTAGAMYGTLDVMRLLSQKDAVHGLQKKPDIQQRGIKMNIPLDARTPSYSDASDSAKQNIENMWDFEFWKEFLQQMARYKYNTLSLWNLHPFPSLVKVPEYPEVALDDVMVSRTQVYSGLGGKEMSNADTRKTLVRLQKISIDEKIDFWKRIMLYAKELSISVYFFTWNIFTFGTEHTSYQLQPTMDCVETIRYFRYSVRELVKTYPLLAGIGITAGELMSRTEADETWLAETYGAGIADALTAEPDRPFTMIHRAHFTQADTIRQAFHQLPATLEYSFKYSQAHMYSHVKPNFGNDFFASLKETGDQTWLTVRNDDYYMFRWADAEYARAYLQSMPHDVLRGFYMGPDGYVWGRDYLSRNDENPLVITRMNDMLRIWGELSYDMELPLAEIKSFMSHDYPDVPIELLYEVWSKASSMLGTIACTRWHDMDFQYYPEGCCRFDNSTLKRPIFCDLEEYITCPAQPGSQHVSVSEYCQGMKDGFMPEGMTPVLVVDAIESNAQRIHESLPSLMAQATQAKTKAVLSDILGMTLLGQYNAAKLRAAIALQLKRLGVENGGDPVCYAKQSAVLWHRYARHCHENYYNQFLTRYQESIDLERFVFNVRLDVQIAQNG